MKIRVKKETLREFIKFCIANKVKPGYFNHIDKIVRYEESDKKGYVKIDKELVDWICKWYNAFSYWKYGYSEILPKDNFYVELRKEL